MADRTVKRRLRAVNATLFSAMGLVSFLSLAGWVKGWWMVTRQPVTWSPHLPPLMAVILALVVVAGALFVVLGRAFSGERPSHTAAGLLLVTTIALLYLRLNRGEPAALASADRPVKATAARMRETGTSLAEAFRRDGRYPTSPAPAGGTNTDEGPGWLSYGRPLPFNLVEERGYGPRLTGRPGDLPGTLYYVVSPAGERFWMTALVLEGAPTGRVVFLKDGAGRPLVFTRGRPRDVDLPQ